jgi:hypothetical protein
MDGLQPNYADNNPPSVLEASDYIATLSRDPASSHLKTAASVFDIL